MHSRAGVLTGITNTSQQKKTGIIDNDCSTYIGLSRKMVSSCSILVLIAKHSTVISSHQKSCVPIQFMYSDSGLDSGLDACIVTICIYKYLLLLCQMKHNKIKFRYIKTSCNILKIKTMGL